MGQWVSKYGEAIYATRGGPFKPKGNVSSTCKENVIFLHFSGDERTINLPEFGYKILNSRLLNGGDVSCNATTNGWEVSIHQAPKNEFDLIVELTIDGNAVDIKPLNFSGSFH